MQRIKIYASEIAVIADETSRHTRIETGGSLFGNCDASGDPQVLLATRPGARSLRGPASFTQDSDFHNDLQQYLWRERQMEWIGLWHSHHYLGLEELSLGDLERTARIASRYSKQYFIDILTFFTHSGWDNLTVSIKGHSYSDPSRACYERTTLVTIDKMSPLRMDERGALSANWPEALAPGDPLVKFELLQCAASTSVRHQQEDATIRRPRVVHNVSERALASAMSELDAELYSLPEELKREVSITGGRDGSIVVTIELRGSRALVMEVDPRSGGLSVLRVSMYLSADAQGEVRKVAEPMDRKGSHLDVRLVFSELTRRYDMLSRSSHADEAAHRGESDGLGRATADTPGSGREDSEG